MLNKAQQIRPRRAHLGYRGKKHVGTTLAVQVLELVNGSASAELLTHSKEGET
jgi:hypothetical protein